MAKTNKGLLKAGLSQEEILELIEMYLQKEFNGTDFETLIHEVSLQGYDNELHVYCKDFMNRSYDICMVEEEGIEDIIFFSTSKTNDEDCTEMNQKQFKSITALMNNIVRLNKNV